jgi:hypothetical protein
MRCHLERDTNIRFSISWWSLGTSHYSFWVGDGQNRSHGEGHVWYGPTEKFNQWIPGQWQAWWSVYLFSLLRSSPITWQPLQKNRTEPTAGRVLCLYLPETWRLLLGGNSSSEQMSHEKSCNFYSLFPLKGQLVLTAAGRKFSTLSPELSAPTLQYIWDSPLDMDPYCHWGINWWACGINRNMPVPQATRLLVARGHRVYWVVPSKHRRKLLKWNQQWSRDQTVDSPTTCSTNVHTRNHKSPWLIFFSLSGARNWAQCSDHMGKCLATKTISSLMRNLHNFPVTNQSFLKTKSTESLEMIKTFKD